MLDFLMISKRSKKSGIVEIYPKFIIKKSNDLMIRGGDFYAIWVEERGLWSTDEQDALQLIDKELTKYAEENKDKIDARIKVLHMWDSESGVIDSWHKYCQKQMRDSFHSLDEKLIFSNVGNKKKDYATKILDYPLEQGETTAWNSLMTTLYSEKERHKIEWAIGAVVSGESTTLQKFIVLYGAAGTGKSTVLNIIQKLFDGYYSVFDAKALGSSNNSFALEAFKSNPLVAIQHDGDLSRIEDNTRLNSLISHETMIVNEKFKSTYANRFKSFLFIGTNKPVKITDAKSGLTRRLIDVSPTGDKIKNKEYKSLIKQVDFELGAIAYHCKEIYLSDTHYYDDYIPTEMLGASNDFYNYVIDYYHVFKKDDGVTLKAAWEMYKTYCDEAKVSYPFSQRIFKEELRNYFHDYRERFNLDDGSRVRSYYVGFRTEKFESMILGGDKEDEDVSLIQLTSSKSRFDSEYADCPAQYATSKETPSKKWDGVKTKLSELDTSKLHYVKVPENHIVIDFDITDGTGEKSFKKNIEEASKWPRTYTELSKSGNGVHLHYIYTGDVSRLSRVYDDHVEVKVFSGKSSLRRKLTKCNDLPIANISSGLPLKGEEKMVNFEAIQSEKGLRTLIKRNLNKEIHPATKPSIDFIYKILDDAYSDGLNYDVTDMRNAILAFAASSTNQAAACIKLVNKMQFKSEDASVSPSNDDADLIFYDVEVFPNLFIVNWKIEGEGNQVVRMINPTSTEIENLLRFRLVGFNCRRYDNHILYARLMGYTNEQLYNLSKKIIGGSKNCFFGEAYNLSYTDVLDFSSKKQSLKKFEIELGLHHQELGLPWDEPVPEELWTKVAEYCDNDVIATEATFNARKADFVARQILADIAGMTVNDTTNSLTTRIIFGNNRKPHDQFNYRNMGEVTDNAYPFIVTDNSIFNNYGDEYTLFNEFQQPVFPGYTYDHGVSMYRGEEVGEGGYVYAEPGMYKNVALLDIASMHPHSIIAEELFGPEYTARFKELVDGRMYIKHEEYDKASTILNGKLTPYLDSGKYTSEDLAFALKIAINSVYGLTAATFDNPVRDIRNVDNIVAKRGALFMINLKNVVQSLGFTVAHVKTDSIKIPDATPEIIEFIMNYAEQYGYTFEHEATYEKMCLVNNSVYIAKYKDGKDAGVWTATGTQFAVPYVFKTLFSKEDIDFSDLCETKTVSTAIYLDMNENLPDVTVQEKQVDAMIKDIKKSGYDPNNRSSIEKDLITQFVTDIPAGHNYVFVGKVGKFTPIKPECGGGLLLRESTSIDAKIWKDLTGDKHYGSVGGAKGYRWLESEMVSILEKEKDVDRSYYDKLVDKAVSTISEYGDFEWFAS